MECLYKTIKQLNSHKMFNKTYPKAKKENAPTINQFLKSLPSKTKVLDQTFFVEIIWLPGKFDNVTLVTHAFRIIIPPSHELYSEINKEFSTDNDFAKIPAIGITVEPDRSGDFSIKPMENKKGEWSTIGANGVKFTLN